MSDKINNGGPAYPQNEYSAYEPYREGMSLRDYFAGQVLIAIGNWTPGTDVPSYEFSEMRKRRAEWAYRQADAMLAARKAGE